jgi:hypothetical protein
MKKANLGSTSLPEFAWNERRKRKIVFFSSVNWIFCQNNAEKEKEFNQKRTKIQFWTLNNAFKVPNVSDRCPIKNWQLFHKAAFVPCSSNPIVYSVYGNATNLIERLWIAGYSRRKNKNSARWILDTAGWLLDFWSMNARYR